jgi:hypothetical protein
MCVKRYEIGTLPPPSVRLMISLSEPVSTLYVVGIAEAPDEVDVPADPPVPPTQAAAIRLMPMSERKWRISWPPRTYR